MSFGYNSLITKENTSYLENKNEMLECLYGFDIERLNKLLNSSKLNYDGHLIFNIICDMFNTVKSNNLLYSELKKLNDIEEVSKCEFSKNKLTLSFKNVDISVKKITKSVDNFNNFNNNNNIYEIINLSKQLKRQNKIVIGYLTEELDKIQKLHFWIEYTKNNETYVVDYLNNIIINKEGYYLLTQPKIINEISSEQLNQDTVTLLSEIFNLEHDEILCFYQELEKDFKKIK